MTYVAALAVLLAASSCASGSGSGTPAAGRHTSSTADARDRPNSPTPTNTSPTVPPPVVRAAGPVAKRCGPPQAPGRWIRLRAPLGSRLAAVEVGNGPTTAVFVHEVGGSGLCGFWPYAVWLDKRYGIRSLLLDLCGYGGSACAESRFAYDSPAQVELAVRWLRTHGARRVTLVGASLGGAVAVVAGAELRPRVDGVVDLSGPVSWPGLPVRSSLPRIHSAALFAVAPYDVAVSVQAMRAALRQVPHPVKRLVTPPSGHGWELLGAWKGDHFKAGHLGALVARWIRRPSTA